MKEKQIFPVRGFFLARNAARCQSNRRQVVQQGRKRDNLQCNPQQNACANNILYFALTLEKITFITQNLV